MPTRTLPPLKLPNSPLVLVLAQARMSAVLQMETYLPSIQEELRRAGYPRFDAMVTQEIVFAPEFKMSNSPSWVFANKDKSEAVVVSPSFVSLMTNRYDTFDAFSERFKLALQTVAQMADVELAERLGLRYVDLVRLQPGEQWADYLAPGLLGPPTEVLQDPAAYTLRFDGRGRTGIGELVTRVLRLSGAFLPPDLVPTELEFDVQLAPDEVVTIIDTDHFAAAPREFDPDALIDEAWLLHDKIDQAFRAAVTPTALERWGAE